MFPYLLIFIFGLLVGSFLNCVIFRLKEGEGFLRGRSYCPECKHILAWYDLIPVLSFIILRRRCRYCQKLISWQYPLVELATATLFIFPLLSSPSLWEGEVGWGRVFYLLIACFLIVIFVYDLKHFIIPDKVLYPAIAISVIYRLVEALCRGSHCQIVNLSNSQIVNYFIAALAVAVFFLMIYLLSRGQWLGFGDVKLGILLGLLLGWPKILLALFLSFVIGGIIGIGLIIFTKKKLKSEVPFAPFLIIGTLIALFWGEPLINWYFSLIL